MKTKIADRYLKVDPWQVIEEGFDPARGRLSESMFCLANEFMGVRGYFDEGYSGDRLQGSYFNNLYEVMHVDHPQLFKGIVTRTCFGVNSVDWLYTRIRLDGEMLDLARVTFGGFIAPARHAHRRDDARVRLDDRQGQEAQAHVRANAQHGPAAVWLSADHVGTAEFLRQGEGSRQDLIFPSCMKSPAVGNRRRPPAPAHGNMARTSGPARAPSIGTAA